MTTPPDLDQPARETDPNDGRVVAVMAVMFAASCLGAAAGWGAAGTAGAIAGMWGAPIIATGLLAWLAPTTRPRR